MNKRRAVSVCVRSAVCVRVRVVSKRVSNHNTISSFFNFEQPHSFSFSVTNIVSIFRQDSHLTGALNAGDMHGFHLTPLTSKFRLQRFSPRVLRMCLPITSHLSVILSTNCSGLEYATTRSRSTGHCRTFLTCPSQGRLLDYSIYTMEQMHHGKSRGKRFCRNLGGECINY